MTDETRPQQQVPPLRDIALGKGEPPKLVRFYQGDPGDPLEALTEQEIAAIIAQQDEPHRASNIVNGSWR